jgi:MobA-like NTP transferase domain/Phosphotransferase enzyme family
MIPRQIIIQAGGRGSRLENLTTNKPKCLVPVDGKPMLQHTLAAFPGAHAVVIVDYRADVVERWLCAFPADRPISLWFSYEKGSAAGIGGAALMLPYRDEPVALIWCDVQLTSAPDVECHLYPVVFTTKDFKCRYEAAAGWGIAGLFYFQNAGALAACPSDGEFVEWLQGVTTPPVQYLPAAGLREYGTLEALQSHWSDTPPRFFNEVTIVGDVVSKRSRSPEFQHLIDDEAAWYRHVRREDFGNIPRVAYSQNALMMGRIAGQHPWQMEPDTGVLAGIFDMLDRLHRLGERPGETTATVEMYCEKPMDRITAIPRLLPPGFLQSGVAINGKRCGNMFGAHHFDRWSTLAAICHADTFHLIHGDPTFSNIIIGPSGFPFLIDPRGRFGSVQFYGDALYDWAKLYYSVIGGYDNFNRGHFTLEMGDGWADIRIKPSRWAGLAGMFEDRLGVEAMRKIRIIHGLIWLSLAGVCVDYDQILGAYFMGLLTLDEALS